MIPSGGHLVPLFEPNAASFDHGPFVWDPRSVTRPPGKLAACWLLAVPTAPASPKVAFHSAVKMNGSMQLDK